jgi:hypothetical protein
MNVNDSSNCCVRSSDGGDEVDEGEVEEDEVVVVRVDGEGDASDFEMVLREDARWSRSFEFTVRDAILQTHQHRIIVDSD